MCVSLKLSKDTAPEHLCTVMVWARGAESPPQSMAMQKYYMMISPQKTLTKIYGVSPILTEFLLPLSLTCLQKYEVVSQWNSHALFCLYNKNKFISKKSIRQAEVFLFKLWICTALLSQGYPLSLQQKKPF